MDIFFFSDESGVFDKAHNDFFVFAGILFLSKQDMNKSKIQYINTENKIKNKLRINKNSELKATMINSNNKRKLLRTSKNSYNFTIIINQKNIYDRIFANKKTKQRYLDYAFKIGIKKFLQFLYFNKKISLDNINNLKIFCDEHTTSTNALYDFETSIYRELKIGTEIFPLNYITPPILLNLQTVTVKYCNSKSNPLIRYSDILANSIFNIIRENKNINFENIYVVSLP